MWPHYRQQGSLSVDYICRVASEETASRIEESRKVIIKSRLLMWLTSPPAVDRPAELEELYQ